MTRRKFTSKFRNKVVLEALKERETAKELPEVPKVDNHSILLLGDNKNE